MNFLKSFSGNVCKSYKFLNKSCIRYIRVSSLSQDVPKKEAKTDEELDILSELMKEPELTEEEILQKRFKSRLPERVYRKFVSKEAVPIGAKYDFELKRLRHYYARHGSDSKLNPGLCWPTREEMLKVIYYDKLFEPPLQETIEKLKSARLAEEKTKKDYEAEVDKNMANLDKWVAEYHAKIEKKKADILELRKKREKLVEEICDYLGYEIDPRDPRFQEAVDQREKERKKALKAKKAEESYEKMIAKLKQISEKSTQKA